MVCFCKYEFKNMYIAFFKRKLSLLQIAITNMYSETLPRPNPRKIDLQPFSTQTRVFSSPTSDNPEKLQPVNWYNSHRPNSQYKATARKSTVHTSPPLSLSAWLLPRGPSRRLIFSPDYITHSGLFRLPICPPCYEGSLL